MLLSCHTRAPFLCSRALEAIPDMELPLAKMEPVDLAVDLGSQELIAKCPRFPECARPDPK
jgi:hypothetical protein